MFKSVLGSYLYTHVVEFLHFDICALHGQKSHCVNTITNPHFTLTLKGIWLTTDMMAAITFLRRFNIMPPHQCVVTDRKIISNK